MVPTGFHVAIGALALSLATGGVALYYRGNAISARAEAAATQVKLNTAVAVNTANETVIKRLTEYRQIDDKLQADLNSKLSALAHQTGLATNAVEQLKDQSAVVKDYLGGVLPDDLVRLLTERRASRQLQAR